MKKFFFTISLLILGLNIFSDELDLYDGKGFNISGKGVDLKITYDMNEKLLRLYFLETKTTYIFLYYNRDVISAIDKVTEWDKVANDNKIKSLKKEIKEFKNTAGLFKSGKEWHKIFETRSSFTFLRNDNKSSLMVSANKFVATDNTALVTDYPEFVIPSGILDEMKKSIGSDVIKKKVEEYENEKGRNDKLFQ